MQAIIEERKRLSQTRVTKAVFPQTTNHHDTLFGGTALQWMDEVSFIAATRFSRQRIVTVSSDKIDFNHPVPAGTVVELVAKVVEVGRTSLKVRVDVFVESLYADGQEKAITGYFSFVAVGEDMKPCPVLPQSFIDGISEARP
ncbi:acyl-CoA thioesterase [Bermanella marisrubri]|uniref:Long-chain acyl-CoA thioester hydrolase family protein n=1 Tax=Bermanella marisrubri TaxID=207949 RepID=Q1N0M6_9GAMM|nr:acyl-CoA thioesterase [Bermanella marisrubri]EAT11807.1 long-chain acyl-CoA thioester hydrolase family protein [Oceanobacter sp. RED65] [Bermanella marisrubri]QIZ83841.1 acyl-CoA thioesterase [Bermanella marisrubri]